MIPRSEYIHTCTMFKSVFKGLELPLDHLMTAATNSVQIDINRLESMLIERHGEYDSSMEDFVREKYGDEAADMIERMLN